MRGADQSAPNPLPLFRQYCFQCHAKGAAMGGMSLDQLTAQASVGEGFDRWQKVIAVLDQHRMPPKGMPQPSDAERLQAVTWIRDSLNAYVKQHEGDPGRVTVRRLTSGEYGYTVHDLTGLDLDLGIDASSDSVGGEGFTNFGDVQFMQDVNLEHYLEAAKAVADHAIIGAGPLEFYTDPGKTGYEMSAINRIKDIYTTYGFRTVSGEGGFAFGQEKYGKAFYAVWRYRHRAKLGEPNVTFKELAAREGITARFAQHIWTVMNNPSLSYPTNEMAARWQKLPAPTTDAKASETAARAGCEALQKFVTGWPSWLFSRGDAAFGGQGDESPLIINDKTLTTQSKHHFVFNHGLRLGAAGRGRGETTGPAKVYLNVTAVNPTATGKPVVIWRNPNITFRQGGGRAQPGATAAADGDADGKAVSVIPRGRGPLPPGKPLREILSEETARKLNFGKSPDDIPIGPNDFASELSASFEVPMPPGVSIFTFQVDAEVGHDRDQIFRITITDREDGSSRGIPVRALLGDPQSAGAKTFKAGVLQLVSLMPPNSNFEPTPADKDPAPEPFDSTYNTPEHDDFVNRVKYVRDDRFIYQNILDDATRARVDQAWNDLYDSFGYHDNYLSIIALHYGIDLKGKHIGDLSAAQIDAMPAEPRMYAKALKTEYESVVAVQAAARRRHVQDCLDFASRAWRRPLTEKEKQSLRAFYDKTISQDPDHRKAIRALLARILVAPAFLYRVEQTSADTRPGVVRPVAAVSPIQPLSNWEMASRLSYFLWASVPDDELRRAAAAGELSDPRQIQRQVKRMLADPKARRLSTEFFGQWLGFYHFDQYKGVDTGRFPEFTNAVKEAMYDEAVSFFEHVIRKDRPVREILFADYDFLNQTLAKFYGVPKEIKSKDAAEFVDGANAFHRGGMLRLGAVLTATSAPLRTSPVKRGDWVLRRVLGTPTPPPPPDAGSIPADDKLFGGLSVRDRLEAHKRNATCANCHARIDPMGFPLEHYDSTGRWRDQYADGKAIWDSGTLLDKREISGVDGLLEYLHGKEDLVMQTLSRKLIGYALGRTVMASDQPLADRIAGSGGSAAFSQLVTEIATSKQFRNRSGRDDAPVETGVKHAAARAPSEFDKVGRR